MRMILIGVAFLAGSGVGTVAALAGLGGVYAALNDAQTTAPAVAPSAPAPAAPPAPATAAATAPSAPAKTTPVQPSATEPTSAHAPQPAPAATTPKPSPRPAPQPAPKAVPKPEPDAEAEGLATLTLIGDAPKEVWLELGSQRHSPGTVVPGTYAIMGTFDDAPAGYLGEASVSAGEQVTVSCSSSWGKCRKQ